MRRVAWVEAKAYRGSEGEWLSLCGHSGTMGPGRDSSDGRALDL